VGGEYEKGGRGMKGMGRLFSVSCPFLPFLMSPLFLISPTTISLLILSQSPFLFSFPSPSLPAIPVLRGVKVVRGAGVWRGRGG